jgi:hypothetical protein
VKVPGRAWLVPPCRPAVPFLCLHGDTEGMSGWPRASGGQATQPRSKHTFSPSRVIRITTNRGAAPRDSAIRPKRATWRFGNSAAMGRPGLVGLSLTIASALKKYSDLVSASEPRTRCREMAGVTPAVTGGHVARTVRSRLVGPIGQPAARRQGAARRQ